MRAAERRNSTELSFKMRLNGRPSSGRGDHGINIWRGRRREAARHTAERLLARRSRPNRNEMRCAQRLGLKGPPRYAAASRRDRERRAHTEPAGTSAGRAHRHRADSEQGTWRAAEGRAAHGRPVLWV